MDDILERLIDSEEHATEEAIPQVAYEAVEEINNLRQEIARLLAKKGRDMSNG